MNTTLLNEVAQVLQTRDKAKTISTAIATAMQCGLELPAAVDFVCGEGFYAKLVSDIYEAAKAKAAAETVSLKVYTGPTSRYEARISETADGEFFALVVYVENNGEERVLHGYKGRHFKTRKAAERSTAKHIEKCQAE